MGKRVNRPLIGMKKAAHSFAETSLATQIQASLIGETLTNASVPVWEKCITLVKRMIRSQIGMLTTADGLVIRKIVTLLQANPIGKTRILAHVAA
jgi:hypothetical protein